MSGDEDPLPQLGGTGAYFSLVGLELGHPLQLLPLYEGRVGLHMQLRGWGKSSAGEWMSPSPIPCLPD